VVLVGDFSEAAALQKISTAYGDIPPSELPVEDAHPEPPQVAERRIDMELPTSTEKLNLGYKCPALGDFDHPALSLLVEVLFGARSSRVRKRLVRDLELATEVRASVGPFRDPGLLEVFGAAREGKTAESLLAVIEEEFDKVCQAPVTDAELEAARSRMELSLIGGLEGVDGKASTIGFYETILGEPAGAFDSLSKLALVGPSDVLRVARRYLTSAARTTLFVRPKGDDGRQVA
jgi:zinc protease